MRGSVLPKELISYEEAATLAAYVGLEDINRACSLYARFLRETQESGIDFDDFDKMRALAFVYDIGRMQGIREERQKKKATPQDSNLK